jgi:hypothetical protein
MISMGCAANGAPIWAGSRRSISSVGFLIRVLAYRLQADAFGGLDKSICRMLRSKRGGNSAVPFDRRAPQTRDGVGPKAGALLVREWKGKLERVMILEDGFAWNGQIFGSLSQIARAMTGTNWNGHRFFGLRQEKTIAAAETTGERRKRGTGAAANVPPPPSPKEAASPS